ncbi:unnamed protein product, partial [Porites evermanni]
WDNLYSFQLALRGCKRFLGTPSAPKHPITPNLLFRMAPLLDRNNSLHAAMWALFLVTFLFFLRKSNLVVITALGVDSRHYSLHSFRRDGATFAFASKVPAELIKFQGDWRSDTYL